MIRILGAIAALAILGYLGAPVSHLAGINLGTIAAGLGQVRTVTCR
jgi:hypothetical protein